MSNEREDDGDDRAFGDDSTVVLPVKRSASASRLSQLAVADASGELVMVLPTVAGTTRTARLKLRQRSESLGDTASIEHKATALNEQLKKALARNRERTGPSSGEQAETGTSVQQAFAQLGSEDDEDEIDGVGAQPSTESAGLAEQIGDMVLLCSVCLDCYTEPKVLPCQHTFCRECLETIVNAQKSKTSILCPECRLEVTLPTNGVRGLTTNFLINKLVDLLHSYKPEDTVRKPSQVMCDICGDEGDHDDSGAVDSSESVAVAHCKDCSLNLCSLHRTAHGRAKTTRMHCTTPIDKEADDVDGGGGDIQPGNSATAALPPPVTASAAAAMSCDRRDHNPTDRWCSTCRTFVCPDCESVIHRSHSHNVVSASLAFLEQVSTLEEKASLLAKLASRAESAVNVLDECQAALETESERVSSTVHTSFQRVIDSFVARRSHLLDEIAQNKTSRVKTLRLQREQLMFQTGNMHSGIASLQSIMNGNDDVALLKASSDLESRARTLLACDLELSPHTCQGMHFDTSWEAAMMADLKELGRVDYSHVSPALCTASGCGLQSTLTRGKEAVININVVDSSGEPCHHADDKVTVVVYPPTKPRATAVQMLRQQSAPSPGMSAPELLHSSLPSRLGTMPRRGLPGTAGRQLLVAVRSGDASSVGHYTCSYLPREEGEHVIEICVNGWPIKNSPFVARVTPGRDYSCIRTAPVVFGCEGQGREEFRSPHGIAFDSDGSVVVSDMINNRIKICSASGTYVRAFGKRGSKVGQFVDPIGLTVDSDDNVAIADYGNHRVQVLSRYGESIRTFGGRGTTGGKFSLPFDVAAFSHPTMGQCYVVTEFENNRVQVLQSDGIPLFMFGSKGSGPGQFKNPAGVAVSNDYMIYVADHNNHRIQTFTVNGDFQRSFGRKGSRQGELEHPCGVALDRLGNVLVSEFTNSRVQVFSAETFDSIAILGEEQKLNFPTGLAIDKSGKVYVCSEHQITIF